MLGCMEGLLALPLMDPLQIFTVHKDIWDLMAVMRLVQGRCVGQTSMLVREVAAAALGVHRGHCVRPWIRSGEMITITMWCCVECLCMKIICEVL